MLSPSVVLWVSVTSSSSAPRGGGGQGAALLLHHGDLRVDAGGLRDRGSADPENSLTFSMTGVGDGPMPPVRK